MAAIDQTTVFATVSRLLEALASAVDPNEAARARDLTRKLNELRGELEPIATEAMELLSSITYRAGKATTPIKQSDLLAKDDDACDGVNHLVDALSGGFALSCAMTQVAEMFEPDTDTMRAAERGMTYEEWFEVRMADLTAKQVEG